MTHRHIIYRPIIAFCMVALFTFAAPSGARADTEFGFSKFSGASGPSEEGFFVATDPEQWYRLWSKVGKPAKGTFVPGVTTGVGIFLGPRPDGDRLRVRKVRDDDGRMEVQLTHRRRSSSGETITPWLILLVRGTSTDVVADIRHEVTTAP